VSDRATADAAVIGSGLVRVVQEGMPPRAALDLRRAVFVDEQAVPAELEFDGLDADADHVVVFDANGRALATARLIEPDGSGAPSDGDPSRSRPYGKIGRVAVRADQRRRGLGATVMEALEQRARERGLHTVVVHAQVEVESFYLRQGYTPEGAHFFVAGIEHVAMRKAM
jgi:predicted GNAT family N-acyltransferase